MISQAIEWIGAHTAVVRLGVRQPSLGTQLRPRAVRIEQAHYRSAHGLAALEQHIALELGRPEYATHASGERVRLRTEAGDQPWVIGGGLGLSAPSAHYVVPARPVMHQGKVVVYRLLDDTEVAESRWAARGTVAVLVLDLIRSRYSSGGCARPEPHVWSAVVEVAGWAAQRHGVDVVGGCDLGCPASPGDWCELELRRGRGETTFTPALTDEDAHVPYRAARDKLLELGFAPDTGDVWGPRSYAALVAFQRLARLLPDGVLGPLTQQALRQSASPR